MIPTEKRNIENLRSVLPIMLEKAGLKRLVPYVHVRISNKLLSYKAGELIQKETSWLIALSDAISPDMRIITIAHEVAHLKIQHSGFCMKFGQLVFHLFFSFIKIENRFRNFGKELFVESIVAPRILASVAPKLLPLQARNRRNLIEKRAPYCSRKIICIFSDLLVSLIDRKGRFFVGIYIHTMAIEEPNIEKEGWIAKRAEFHQSKGMSGDEAYEKALEESETEGKKMEGMYADPQTGEVMTEETRKKIEKEMKEKGADKERPGTIH
ncbi:MAG: hypothetical protein Q8O83_05245 [bacterium]|nr:hypothetical protein [bacterium]